MPIVKYHSKTIFVSELDESIITDSSQDACDQYQAAYEAGIDVTPYKEWQARLLVERVEEPDEEPVLPGELVIPDE